MSWQIFEQRAARYDDWYRTPRGKAVSRQECALLAHLLGDFPTAHSVFEIGCGSGHFTAWLRQRGLLVVGLDRSPAMLDELRRRSPAIPVVLGDAHRLPIRSGAVDLCLFVTVLEFLDDPRRALLEARAVARQGILVIALNRWSLGGLSRRCGRQAKRPILGRARDLSILELRAMALAALPPRPLQQMHWIATLFPPPFRRFRTRIPFGDVLGMAVRFSAGKPIEGKPCRRTQNFDRG